MNNIEWAERDAMVANTTAEADRHLCHAAKLRHELEEFAGLCHTCHGKGKVWDSSGECARRQAPRRCPVCDGCARIQGSGAAWSKWDDGSR